MEKQNTESRKWSIIIPLLVSVLSIIFNIFQYIDKRQLEKEKLLLSNKKDEMQINFDKRSKEIQIHIDSLNLKDKIQEMNAKLPSFEFSYYGMSVATFTQLSQQSDTQINKLEHLQGHPLVSSKYLKNNVMKNDNGKIMILMIKQVGGSKANDVQIDYDSYNLNSSLGFSFQSDIVNLLRKFGITQGAFRLGQILPTQSVVVPLFTYYENPKGSHDSYSIEGNIYVPKFIQFTDMDGKEKKIEIRKMLENPFSITVDLDERG